MWRIYNNSYTSNIKRKGAGVMNNHNKMIELLEDNFSLHDADQIYELLDEFYSIDTKQGEITFFKWLENR